MASLLTTPQRVGSRILGTGSYRPERIVDNHEVALLIDSSDEWIRERSGIIERRYCAPGETLTDMAVAAGAKAIAAGRRIPAKRMRGRRYRGRARRSWRDAR